MYKRRGIRLALTLLCAGVLSATLLGVSACQKTETSERPPEAGDTAVARIDGETIWTSDVRNEAINQGVIGKGEPLDMTSDLFSRTLQEVIDQRLLARAARDKGLDKSVTAQRRLAAANDRILGDMLVETTIDRDIDDKAVKDQYDQQVKLSKQSEEIRTRIILLKTQQDAQDVLKNLQGGGVFEAVAMERSVDQATRFNGGDMGYYTTDIMPQAYKGVLTTAKVGDIVGPVQTDAGWAILRVEDRRPEQLPSLEEERPVIMRYLIYNQVAGLLKSLRKDAKLEMLVKASAMNDESGQEPASAPNQAADDAVDSSDDGAGSSSVSSSSSAASHSRATAKPVAMSTASGPSKSGAGVPDKTSVPAGFHGLAPASAKGR